MGFKPFVVVRGFFLVCIVFASLAAGQSAHAIENLRKYAGIVVDAKSGEVLYQTEADSRRYPASLSKVMTLYIVFQELKAGNLSLATKLTVSRHAASAVPTKLGLRAGATITLGDAMKSLVTLSANDMARAIAEHISGTEEKFGERMTATARALGMAKTTYRNASGLPDGAQITTVRDQSILASAVFQHFPEYYELFQTTSFSYGDRTYGNHNRVLGYMGAVDGIKTGFINASGSNLMTAARKDGRHVVIIAFGFNSGAARDEKVRQLVRDHFAKGRQGDYLQVAVIPVPGRQTGTNVTMPAVAVPVMPLPLPGFRMAEILSRANVQASNAPQMALASLSGNTAVEAAAGLAGAQDFPYQNHDVIGAWLSDTFSLEPLPSSRVAPVPFLPPARVDHVLTNSIGSGGAAIGSWHVQLGATPHFASAQIMIEDAAKHHEPLRNIRPHIERFDRHGHTLYRARYVGFGSRNIASEACTKLAEASLPCLVVGG